jgi:hypothetical protein
VLSRPLRTINPIVTAVLAGLREKLVNFYSDIGRPSINPDLMTQTLMGELAIAAAMAAPPSLSSSISFRFASTILHSRTSFALSVEATNCRRQGRGPRCPGRAQRTRRPQINFSNDPLPDIGVERAPQVGKGVNRQSLEHMELFYIS